METITKNTFVNYEKLLPLFTLILSAKQEYPEYAPMLEDFYMNAMESLQGKKTTLKFELELMERCVQQIKELINE